MKEMKPRELLKFISNAYEREGEGIFHGFDRRGFVYLCDFDKKELIVYCSDFGRAIGKKGANVKRLQKNTGMKVTIRDIKELPVCPVDYPILRKIGGKLEKPLPDYDEFYGSYAKNEWIDASNVPAIDIEEIKKSNDV